MTKALLLLLVALTCPTSLSPHPSERMRDVKGALSVRDWIQSIDNLSRSIDACDRIYESLSMDANKWNQSELSQTNAALLRALHGNLITFQKSKDSLKFAPYGAESTAYICESSDLIEKFGTTVLSVRGDFPSIVDGDLETETAKITTDAVKASAKLAIHKLAVLRWYDRNCRPEPRW